MDVGTKLRTARERRNLSIDQLARATKISGGLLIAIENNAFDKLPGGIFARGFIRAYAREVGLDAEDMVSAFLAQTGAGTLAEANGEHSPELAPGGHVPLSVDEGDPPSAGSGAWGYMLIVAVLLIALVSYTRSPEREELIADEPFAAEPTGAGLPEGMPDVQATSGAGAARPSSPMPMPQTVATDGGLLQIEVAPHGPCWVEVVADGRTVVYRLMQAGERETFDARGEVTLLAGDPSTFAFSVNGRAGRPLGPPAVPTRIRLTGENYRTFLAE